MHKIRYIKTKQHEPGIKESKQLFRYQKKVSGLQFPEAYILLEWCKDSDEN